VENLNRVAQKLVVMAETKINDAADKRIEIRLIPLNADVGLEREKLKRYLLRTPCYHIAPSRIATGTRQCLPEIQKNRSTFTTNISGQTPDSASFLQKMSDGPQGFKYLISVPAG
jgi:hypothetical protein